MKYKPGNPITDPQVFLGKLIKREKFYFAGTLTDAHVPMNWQVSTMIRYCQMPQGMLREAVPQD